MCYSISASMAPKLKVQPPELLGFGFPEAVHMQSSLRWDNNSASLSLLAMCYILDTECSLVEKQPKTVLQLFAAFCKHTFIFEFHCMQPFSVNFGLYQCFLKEENSQLHVCKDKVICILSCLSKVKVLHEELGPEGVFKKKKKGAVRFEEFTMELCWTDPEEGSCYPTCVLCPKRDFGIFPTASRENCICSLSPKGNHQSTKRRKSFLYILANSIFPILL